jgi:hypothetical protein
LRLDAAALARSFQARGIAEEQAGELMNALMKGGLCLLALAFAASSYAADLIVLKPHTFDIPVAAKQP